LQILSEKNAEKLPKWKKYEQKPFVFTSAEAIISGKTWITGRQFPD